MVAQAPPMFPRSDTSGSGFPSGGSGGGDAGSGFPGGSPAAAGAGNFSGAGLPSNATGGAAVSPLAATGASPGAVSAGAVPLFPFFVPSFDVALAAAVVFFALTAAHVYLSFRTKAWYFSLAAQAALFFTVGVVLRLVVITNMSLFQPFVISQLLLSGIGSIMGILLIFTYTRLMWWVTPAKHRNITTLWLPPMANSFILGAGQAVADIIGVLGQGQIINPPPPRLTAIGSVLEMLVWMFLMFLVLRFTYINRRWPMAEGVRQGSLELGGALSVCTVLLSIRGVMQVLEKDALTTLTTKFTPTPVITTEEWPFWVFSVGPNLGILAILAVYHPGLYLPRRLTGFRLKTKALLEEEQAMKDDEEVSTLASNGWAISSPKLIDPDKAGSMGVASLYANAYAMEDEKQAYTLTNVNQMGYAR